MHFVRYLIEISKVYIKCFNDLYPLALKFNNNMTYPLSNTLTCFVIVVNFRI